MEELFTPEFWDRKWIEFKVKNATYRGQKKDAEEYWNQRAEGFANSTIKSDCSNLVKMIYYSHSR